MIAETSESGDQFRHIVAGKFRYPFPYDYGRSCYLALQVFTWSFKLPILGDHAPPGIRAENDAHARRVLTQLFWRYIGAV